MPPMDTDEIRDTFIRFYESKGHLRIPSASLVPHGDPTLLFTGAGMVPFKPYFIGLAEPPARRLTTVQKCFRTTDIEKVGDYGHLTFFEMLGNFSIGDYFKEEAIAWAWELLTERFRLPPEKLWVSIFLTDEEAHDIWRRIGVPEERIHRYGEEHNYWFSGDVGPCGPNSEIFVDRGPRPDCEYCAAGACKPNLEPDCGRFLEVWNLVFMTLYQAEDGTRTELPRKNIDTGSGLERVAVALQDKDTVYETDIFRPILAKVAALSELTYPVVPASDHSVTIVSAERQNQAMRIVAEHTRAAVFLMADGVLPSNEGRGNVVHRLIKRAIYFSTRWGVTPDLAEVASAVIRQMQGAYPELKSSARLITSVLEHERGQSYETIVRGGVLLDSHLSNLSAEALSVVPADVVFRLVTTHGFPKELISEVAHGRGFTLDERRFGKLMEGHRRRSRAAAKFEAIAQREFAYAHFPKTEFTGYESLSERTSILGIIDDSGERAQATAGEQVEIILERTSFYAEGGGQVGDCGEIVGGTARLSVEDTQLTVTGVYAHKCKVLDGKALKGDAVTAIVDAEKRRASQRNHTATHLLHAALRQVLGTHVRQAGSLVAPDRLRFDFTHIEATKPEELAAVQRLVNEKIREDIEVHPHEMPYDEAIAGGALALFGEKYSAKVRVVDICEPASQDSKERTANSKQPEHMHCFSKELCGGTHCHRTGEIGTFVIVSEGSVGSGLRRLEALAGPLADAYVIEQQEKIGRLSRRLNTTPGELESRVEALDAELEAERRRAQQLERQAGRAEVDTLLGAAENVNGASVLVSRVPAGSVEAMREMGDMLRDRLGSAVVVLGAVLGDRPSFLAMVTKDLTPRVHAGNLIKQVAAVTGGGGGGRPEMAQAGGKDAARLDEALQVAKRLARESLAAQVARRPVRRRPPK